MWWGLFILFLVLLAAVSIVWSTLRNGISPMPTSSKVKRQFIESLPKQITGSIYELGAGWGSLAFPLAERYPLCTVLAYENSLVPYLFCRLRLIWYPLPNLQFVHKNFFQVSLSDASLVACYLFPDAMRKLKDKFRNELPPQALIATHTFAIPGWQPIFTVTVDDLYHTVIYHYSANQESDPTNLPT